jgi:hypothetical protein
MILSKSKKLILATIMCLGVAILGVIIFLSPNNRQERTLTTVINQIFTWPSSKLENELDNVQGGTLIGENVPSHENKPSNVEEVLSGMYGKYFTDDSFNKFCRERIPLQYLLFAKQHNYKVSLKKIDSKQSDDTPNYYLFSAELLVEHEDGRKEMVVENGTVLFSDIHKIENVWVYGKLLQLK